MSLAPRPVEVEVAAVWQGQFEQAIDEDGRTRLKQRYTISAPVAARLERIALREGVCVAAGDIVAQLTPVMSSMVDERSIREAKARLQGASASVERAATRIARGRIAVQQAQLEVQRTERLAPDGFLPGSRLDSDRLALGAAERELDVSIAEHDVAVHEQQLAAAVLRPPGGTETNVGSLKESGRRWPVSP